MEGVCQPPTCCSGQAMGCPRLLPHLVQVALCFHSPTRPRVLVLGCFGVGGSGWLRWVSPGGTWMLLWDTRLLLLPAPETA